MAKYSKLESKNRVVEKIANSNTNSLPKAISPKSVCTESFIRTNDNLKVFFKNVDRKHPHNYKYDNLEELEQACNDFIALCLNNSLYPTIELLACYLGVSSDWIIRVANNSGDSRCTTIKRVRDEIKAILTQHTLTKEGNPAGNIFHLKSTFGMSENNVITFHQESNEESSYEDKNAILEALRLSQLECNSNNKEAE